MDKEKGPIGEFSCCRLHQEEEQEEEQEEQEEEEGE